MDSDLLNIIGAVGLTFIITKAKILRWLREWLSTHYKYLGELFSCPQCIGLWIGFGWCAHDFFDKESLNFALIVSLLGYLIEKLFESRR